MVDVNGFMVTLNHIDALAGFGSIIPVLALFLFAFSVIITVEEILMTDDGKNPRPPVPYIADGSQDAAVIVALTSSTG